MIRQFFNDSAIYVIPTILSRGIGFFLLPVYTYYLAPAEYGVLEFLAVTFAMLNLLLPLEVSQAVARFLPEAEVQKKILYASTAFWFTTIVFSAFAIIVWLFPKAMGSIILGNSELANVVSLGALAMLANALLYLMLNQLRWNLQAKASAVVSVTFSVCMAFVAVVLVAFFDYGVIGYIWGQLTGSVIALTVGLYCSRHTIPIRLDFDSSLLREMLYFSAPLVLSSMAVYISLYADRWVIRELIGVDAVGIYSVANRVASITTLAIIAFQMSLTPLVYKHYKNAETPKTIGNIFSYFLLLVLPLIALIGAFSPEIISLISSPAYQQADRVSPWLALSAVMMGVYVFAPGLGIAKKTGAIALINVIVAVENVILNLIWVPVFGLMGAAIATLCSAFTVAALYFWLGNREYAVTYHKLRCIMALIATVLFILLVNQLPLSLDIRTIFWLLFAMIIIFIQMRASDWESLKRLRVKS